jgi:hypothetical protein
MKSTLVLVLAALTSPCWSQTAAAPLAPAARPLPAETQTDRGEPDVRHSRVEDDGSTIDELRVRGQVTHVVVTPKVGTTKSYEIIVGRSGREPLDGTGGANSATGKRVWNVLAF